MKKLFLFFFMTLLFSEFIAKGSNLEGSGKMTSLKTEVNINL